jgi:hypothetical protein
MPSTSTVAVPSETRSKPLHKDEILDRLSKRWNVAQFAAFRPQASGPRQSFSRIAAHDPNEMFLGIREAIDALLACSGDHKVNIRSYLPDQPRSQEFIYGLSSSEDAAAAVERLSSEGLHTIVNETIDVSDGGVSGVLQGHTLEFAPDDTPRCVEKPGVTSMPFQQGMQLLRTVYGFEPELEARKGDRVEFSIHPRVRGWRQRHTLIWEHETDVPDVPPAGWRWPNHFSRMLGDKAYGLLVADLMNYPVPRTLVIGRRIAPFRFGRTTTSSEVWTRTCPFEPHPGLYTTVKGWTDPFALLQAEDPAGKVIASVLCQDAIKAGHSGAAIMGPAGEIMIEGRHGEGDRLMLGLDRPEPLPENVLEDVRALCRTISGKLGPIRFEWVHDGTVTWVVQLHVGATATQGSTLVPGDPAEWFEFPVDRGLDALRTTLEGLPPNTGILLIGEVGVTSHIADLVRRAAAPARVLVRA